VSGLVDTINSPEYATSVGLMMLDMILEGQAPGVISMPSGLYSASKLASKFKKFIKR
jgi:hypothetical protein